MRIHLGHHFYGAGNLGDDFMVAGLLTALRRLAPGAKLTGSVPFAAGPLAARFPEIEWRPFTAAERERSIAECDLWLGLGGSPFQHAQSRWFLDHLQEEAAGCRRCGKPMAYLGVGLQSAAEATAPEVRTLVEQAVGVWTRDPQSAEWLAAGAPRARVEAAADLAHVWFRDVAPPAARAGRLTLVANFDYGSWPGQAAALAAVRAIAPRERVWLAQESRELPGAEKALHAALDDDERSHWQLVEPERPGAPLRTVMAAWPSGEWLLTSRYHAALTGAWSGARIVVIATNAKLAAAAREIGAAVVTPDASRAEVQRALQAAAPARAGIAAAALAEQATAAALAVGLRSGIARGQ